MSSAQQNADNKYDRFKIITGAGFTPTFRRLIPNPDYPDVDPVNKFIPFDLTGYTARMDIRCGPAKTDLLIKSLTTENGGITLGGALGTITLFISGDETNDTATDTDIGNNIGVNYYDFFFFSNVPGEQPEQFLVGEITIVESVSDV